MVTAQYKSRSAQSNLRHHLTSIKPPLVPPSPTLTPTPSTTMDPSAPDSQQQQHQLYYPPHVLANQSRIYSTKFLTSCFAGAAAGILGLENFRGFAVFVLATLFSSVLLRSRCKGLPKKYVPGGWIELVNPGQENLFSFLLVWTLFYGLSFSYFKFYPTLTRFPGIVHGKITHAARLRREFNADDDIKCMTSHGHLWKLFDCSFLNVDAAFINELCYPLWLSGRGDLISR